MKKLYPLLLTLLLVSCDGFNFGWPVQFKTSQPATSKEKSVFKKSIRGEYFSINTTDRFLIEASQITHISVHHSKISKNDLSEIDSSLTVNSSTEEITSHLTINQFQNIQILNDSIFYDKIDSSIQFKIDTNQVLKYKNKKYYLNYKTKEDRWIAFQISKKNDLLILSSIKPTKELALLKHTVLEVSDTVQMDSIYLLSPTKKEFKNLIWNDFLEDSFYKN